LVAKEEEEEELEGERGPRLRAWLVLLLLLLVVDNYVGREMRHGMEC